MDLLLSHWHCILPVAAILVAMAFMRSKEAKSGEEENGNGPRPAEKE
jgi:hypothetical protein